MRDDYSSFHLGPPFAFQVENPSTPNDEGITPLHNAVCAGHHHIVKFLLDFGVNVNAADSDGWWDDDASLILHDLLLYPFLFMIICVRLAAGLRFTVPPPATVSICASCWSSQGPPSLPAQLAMWRLLQINVKKWKRATSSAPSFYMVRNTNPASWVYC